MNKKKKWIITAIILAVFCAALGIYNYYANRSTNEEEVTRTASPRSKNILNVNGVIIRPQSLTDGITTVGNLLPDEEDDLSFETSGKIVAINFQEGAAVRKGELLAKVNDKPCWPSSRATKPSSNSPKTASTARAPCSNRMP